LLLPEFCDYGRHKVSILPPTAITLNSPTIHRPTSVMTPAAKFAALSRELDTVAVGGHAGWSINFPPNASPLLVFINTKSGGNFGVSLMRMFKGLLNPVQVFDLHKNGPGPGLKMMQEHQGPFRALGCGGDGTIGWILQEADKLGLKDMQLGVLPLGTGNDLARVLGWGGSYEPSDLADLSDKLDKIEKSTAKLFDRWSITASGEAHGTSVAAIDAARAAADAARNGTGPGAITREASAQSLNDRTEIDSTRSDGDNLRFGAGLFRQTGCCSKHGIGTHMCCGLEARPACDAIGCLSGCPLPLFSPFISYIMPPRSRFNTISRSNPLRRELEADENGAPVASNFAADDEVGAAGLRPSSMVLRPPDVDVDAAKKAYSSVKRYGRMIELFLHGVEKLFAGEDDTGAEELSDDDLAGTVEDFVKSCHMLNDLVEGRTSSTGTDERVEDGLLSLCDRLEDAVSAFIALLYEEQTNDSDAHTAMIPLRAALANVSDAAADQASKASARNSPIPTRTPEKKPGNSALDLKGLGISSEKSFKVKDSGMRRVATKLLGKRGTKIHTPAAPSVAPMAEEEIDAEISVMNNYFGIGLDAKVAMDFDTFRNQNPEKCRSRMKNQMWYGVMYGDRGWWSVCARGWRWIIHLLA
jgi:hypothetical protein